MSSHVFGRSSVSASKRSEEERKRGREGGDIGSGDAECSAPLLRGLWALAASTRGGIAAAATANSSRGQRERDASGTM